MDFAGRLHDKLRRKRVRGRFWSKHAHGQEERLQLSRIGDREDIDKSDNGSDSQWRGASKRRGSGIRQRIGFIRDGDASWKDTAVLSLGKLCEEYGYSYHWTSGQKPHHIINGKKMHCDTSNHVPFVVPGLSASSSTEELQSDELQGVP